MNQSHGGLHRIYLEDIGAPAGCGDTGVGPSPKDPFMAGYASCMIMAMDIAAKKGRTDLESLVLVLPVPPF